MYNGRLRLHGTRVRSLKSRFLEMSMYQYTIDNQSKHAKQFQTIRKLLLSYPQIKEVKNAKQTSYRDPYGVIIMLRTKGENLVVAFGKGAKLQAHYPQLQGNGKIVRHLYYKHNDIIDKSLLKEMIEESMILGIEACEMKRVKPKR